MKFGVCNIIKNENLYLREWVEYYINLGFDKIILYDNNEPNGEIPNIVIQDYIDAGYVDIISWKKQSKTYDEWRVIHLGSYNNCLEKYKDELDWIAFLDTDEFLELEKHKKIQYVFDEYSDYTKYDVILLQWYIMCDKNELYYRDEKIQNRFTKGMDKISGYAEAKDINLYIKSFVNLHSGVKFVHHPHCPLSENICTTLLEKCQGECEPASINVHRHNIMYVKHYFTKSLTEFLYKMYNKGIHAIYRDIEKYKAINGWSEEHEKIYQNFLNMDNEKAS